LAFKKNSNYTLGTGELFEFFSSPQYSDFALEQKLHNAFFEVFLVQIWQNFGKHIPKFVFKAKNIRKIRFKIFIQGQNRNILGGGVRRAGGENFNFLSLEACL
jgi:hypothetical protein